MRLATKIKNRVVAWHLSRHDEKKGFEKIRLLTDGLMGKGSLHWKEKQGIASVNM